MTLLHTFLAQALNVSAASVPSELKRRVFGSPFAPTLGPLIPRLLDADPAIVSELWKFSVTLDIPHQLLCDAYWLQQRMGVTCADRLKVG